MALPCYVSTEWVGLGHAILRFRPKKVPAVVTDDTAEKVPAVVGDDTPKKMPAEVADDTPNKEAQHPVETYMLECYLSAVYIREYGERKSKVSKGCKETSQHQEGVEEPLAPNNGHEVDTKYLNVVDNNSLTLMEDENNDLRPPGVVPEVWNAWLDYWEAWKEVLIPLSWVHKYRDHCTPEYITWHDSYLNDFPEVLPLITDELGSSELHEGTTKQTPAFEDKDSDVDLTEFYDMIYDNDSENGNETQKALDGKPGMNEEPKHTSDGSTDGNTAPDDTRGECVNRKVLDDLYVKHTKKRYLVHLRSFLHRSGVECGQDVDVFFETEGGIKFSIQASDEACNGEMNATEGSRDELKGEQVQGEEKDTLNYEENCSHGNATPHCDRENKWTWQEEQIEHIREAVMENVTEASTHEELHLSSSSVLQELGDNGRESFHKDLVCMDKRTEPDVSGATEVMSASSVEEEESEREVDTEDYSGSTSSHQKHKTSKRKRRKKDPVRSQGMSWALRYVQKKAASHDKEETPQPSGMVPVSLRSPEAVPGSLEVVPAIPEAVPGSLEAVPAIPEAVPGSLETVPPILEVVPGSLEAVSAVSEAVPRSLEAAPAVPESLKDETRETPEIDFGTSKADSETSESGINDFLGWTDETKKKVQKEDDREETPPETTDAAPAIPEAVPESSADKTFETSEMSSGTSETSEADYEIYEVPDPGINDFFGWTNETKKNVQKKDDREETPGESVDAAPGTTLKERMNAPSDDEEDHREFFEFIDETERQYWKKYNKDVEEKAQHEALQKPCTGLAKMQTIFCAILDRAVVNLKKVFLPFTALHLLNLGFPGSAVVEYESSVTEEVPGERERLRQNFDHLLYVQERKLRRILPYMTELCLMTLKNIVVPQCVHHFTNLALLAASETELQFPSVVFGVRWLPKPDASFCVDGKNIKRQQRRLHRWLEVQEPNLSPSCTVELRGLVMHRVNANPDTRKSQWVYQQVVKDEGETEDSYPHLTLQTIHPLGKPDESEGSNVLDELITFDKDGNFCVGNNNVTSEQSQDSEYAEEKAWNRIIFGCQRLSYWKPNSSLPPDLPQDIHKYWAQRYRLFLKYDEGIKLDNESWYSVTPEFLAAHQARRCKCEVAVDAMCGAGGNAIQLAKTCRHVIAIDKDPRKVELARHNAEVYGVADRIEFRVGNFFKLAPYLKADVVYLSPPWGGMEYLEEGVYNVYRLGGTMNCARLLRTARGITPNVALYLPRNSDLCQVIALAGVDGIVDIETNFMGPKKKAITAYFGDLAAKCF